jgi:phage-related protein
VAITVGSVEVDVIPNTRGIYSRLRAGIVPAATRAGEDAGTAAGRSFGPAMQREVGAVGLAIGQQIGQQIANRITSEVRGAIANGVNQGGASARASAARQGEEVGGAFSRSIKTRLEAAFSSLPKLQIDANTSEADSDLQALRVRMETLAGKRVGIDIDAGAARAEIRLIEAELERLGARHPNVQVRADTAAARAQLALVHAEIEAVDGQTARIDVDTSGALSAILHLTVAIGGLALIPAIPILAAGIGAIASAATAAGAGVGALAAVAVPAFIGIAGALQAQKAAQDAAANSSQRGAQAGQQAASRALQQAGAAQALAAAQRNAASQIASARDQIAQSARGVTDAERQLADAQEDSRQAQLDLVSARREAAQQLEDLSNRYASAQLSQREAQLSLAEAQQRARETEADPKASLLDRQRAALAVDQATQRLREQNLETKRLSEQNTQAAKTGVEGTEVVRQAQDRLADSQERVADRARGVADAQRQVVKAQENLARVQVQAADSIASAQRQMASASLSAAGGVDQAAIAQAKYQAALDKLSPSARGTFDAFQSLRTAFKGWSESLQPAVMPLFTRALEGIKNSLPGLTPFVLNAAKAIGILQDKISAGFKSPWWNSFRDDLAKAVVPATVGLGTAIGNVFKTLGGIVDAFLPHMDEVSARMREITGRWATWGAGLKGSEKFTNFLAYSAEQGPILAKVLGDIGSAIFQISRAVSPLTGPVLGTLGAVLTAIASIAETLPWLIQLLYAAWVVTKLWTLSLIIFNAVMMANPIVLIVVGIIALVAAVIYAYKHWTWFRETVDAAWRGIVAGAKYVWSILQPILVGIWAALQVVGAAALWLWENGIKPAFENIWLAARFLWAVVAVAVIAPLVIWFKILGAIASWLWESTFKPAFEGIAAAALWLWNTVLKPVFSYIGEKAVALWRDYLSPTWDAIVLGVRLLGAWFRGLWNDQVNPVFGWIAEKAAWLYENGIKPHFDRIKTAVGLVKDAFSLARDGIKTVWNELEEITRKPVRFIVETVYNGGIVPVWNAVAKIAGLNQLEKMKFASGGSVFGAGTATSDSIPALLSNGEHVWTAREVQAAGGHSVVESLRQRALQSGSTFAAGGAVGIPRFAEGGVVDWLSDKAQQIGGAVMSALDVVSNPGKAWETATKSLRDKIGEGLSGNQWAQALSQLPLSMLKGLKDKVVSGIENLIGGGTASGSVAAAMAFARSQHGKPYQWGGAGNPSWDCSGFMSGIQKVIMGQSPLGRLWSTFSFQGDTAPAGWRRGLRSPFMVGITNAGVGHTAGTLGGMNVESRGGDGVITGSRARGYNDSLFTDWYGFAPALGVFDQGGYLQPGMNLAYNGTGRPEPVLTQSQMRTLAFNRPNTGTGLEDKVVVLQVQDGPTLHAYVDHRADSRVVHGMKTLMRNVELGRTM